MEKLIKINLDQEYKRSIYGLGEIYEMISVNKKRISLKKKFRQGEFFIAPNKIHGDRGFVLENLKKELKLNYPKMKIVEEGYIDCPPWRSAPKSAGQVNKIIYNVLIVFIVKIIFNFLVLFEKIFAQPKNSHMIYILMR